MASTFKLDPDQKVGVFGPANVYGSETSRGEQVLLFDTAQNVSVMRTVDRVDFAGKSSDYTFVANAGTLYVLNKASTIVSTITIHGSNATQLAFADGGINAGLGSGGTVMLGNQQISTTAATLNGNGLDAGVRTEVPGISSDSPENTDGAEPNDTLEAAATLNGQTGSLQNLAISNGSDVDYYKFTLEGQGSADNFIRANFTHASGDLDMRLYNSSGSQVTSAISSTDNESIQLKDLDAGTYYVAVKGTGGATNSYSLDWNITPLYLADEKEPNDSRDTATMLTGHTGTLEGLNIHTKNDQDYFKFTLDGQGSSTNFIRANFTHASGDLEMYLYNSSGSQVASAASNTDNEEISLNGLDAGDYYVRVRGSSSTVLNEYSLDWNTTPRHLADDYETNNSWDKAYSLENQKSGKLSGLSIHNKNDVDYFKIVLDEEGTANNFVRIDFTNNSGNLNLNLYNSLNKRVKYSSSSTADAEEISLEGLAAGEYYINVLGWNSNVNDYTLEWNTSSDKPADTFESNDSIATATAITELAATQSDLSIHNSSDVDYYKLELDRRQTAEDYVKIAFDNSHGDLDISLLDADGNALLTSAGYQNGEEISLNNVGVGTYYLKVEGYSSAFNEYTLSHKINSGQQYDTDGAISIGNPPPSIYNMPREIGVSSQFVKNAAVGLSELYLPKIQVKDRTDDTLTLTYTCSNGKFFLKGAPNVAYQQPNDTTIKVTGSMDDINELVAHIGFEPSATTVSRIKAELDPATVFTATVTDGTNTVEKSYNLVAQDAGYTVVSMSDGDTAYVHGVSVGASDFVLDAYHYPTSVPTYTGAGVFDAEKNGESGDKDDQMCWAATASNMLSLSGWGQYALGVGADAAVEDTIFECFQDNFKYGATRGGRAEFGIEWFFSGYHEPSKSLVRYANFDKTDTTTGFVKDASGNSVSADPYLTVVELYTKNPVLPIYASSGWDSVKNSMQLLTDTLQNGGAVGLAIGNYVDGVRKGGHAITCVGYTVNESYVSSNPHYYTGLIISDSDDNETSPVTAAPDKLRVLDIFWNSSKEYYTIEGLFTANEAVLDRMAMLSACNGVDASVGEYGYYEITPPNDVDFEGGYDVTLAGLDTITIDEQNIA